MDLVRAYQTGLSWKALLGQRSLARLRGQLIQLTHREGRESWAKRQNCIWCEEDIPGGASHHVLEHCPAWTTERLRFRRARAGVSEEGLLRQLLAARAGEDGYLEGAEWAKDLDASAARFWARAR